MTVRNEVEARLFYYRSSKLFRTLIYESVHQESKEYNRVIDKLLVQHSITTTYR